MQYYNTTFNITICKQYQSLDSHDIHNIHAQKAHKQAILQHKTTQSVTNPSNSPQRSRVSSRPSPSPQNGISRPPHHHQTDPPLTPKCLMEVMDHIERTSAGSTTHGSRVTTGRGRTRSRSYGHRVSLGHGRAGSATYGRKVSMDRGCAGSTTHSRRVT
jgi:hypothetical protein